MLEAKPALAASFVGLIELAAALGVELFEHALIQLPRAVLVGVGQRRAARRRFHTEMSQFAFRTGQPAADLAQRLRLGELAEQHRDELRPAAETPCVALGVVLAYGLFKFSARKQRGDLVEDATN